MSLRTRDIPEVVGHELETNANKIKLYMAVMDLVAKMEGIKLGKKERLAAATIGGAMGPYDSAFDRYDIRTARANGKAILDILSGEGTGEQLEPAVNRAIQLAQDNLNDSAMSALKDLTQAQVDSIKQREGSGVDASVIEDITKRKGANTALLFALEVNPDMSVKKRKCYEELGFLFQLVDDFNDEAMDKAQGITTLATLSEDKARLVKRIQKQYETVHRLFTSSYEAYQLVDFFTYLDKLVAGVGFLKN